MITRCRNSSSFLLLLWYSPRWSSPADSTSLNLPHHCTALWLVSLRFWCFGWSSAADLDLIGWTASLDVSEATQSESGGSLAAPLILRSTRNYLLIRSFAASTRSVSLSQRVVWVLVLHLRSYSTFASDDLTPLRKGSQCWMIQCFESNLCLLFSTKIPFGSWSYLSQPEASCSRIPSPPSSPAAPQLTATGESSCFYFS